MYPCYGDYWLAGAPPELDYDYADDDYDLYLFWPSSSQVLVPADSWYPEDFEPVSPLELSLAEVDDELDELDALDLGSSQLLNFEPTYSFDSNFVFPNNNSVEDVYGYSRFFRMGLASKSRRFTRELDGLLKSAWQSFVSSVRRSRRLSCLAASSFVP